MPEPRSRRAVVSAALLELHGRAVERWSPSTRRRFGLVIALVAAVLATVAIATPADAPLPRIDLFPYLGLVVACWVGAGGALVPVPGIRPLSWVMVVQQSVSLDPLFVAGLSALAMALGQSSLYIAAEHGARHHRAHEGPRGRPDGGHAPEKVAPTIGATDESASRVGRVERARVRVTSTGRRTAQRLERHPVGSVLLLSVVPSPLTSMASGAAGAAGMPFLTFFLASLAGFLVFVGLLVVLGASLLALFGISAS